MKRFTLIMAAAALVVPAFVSAQNFTKNWEEFCGVDPAGDEVRNMSIYEAGGVLATVHRGAAADAIKLFNLADGTAATPANLDMGTIPAGTYNIVAGAFSDDGAFFACNLAHSSPMLLTVYYWTDVNAAPVTIYTAPAYLGYRLGDAMDVVGSVSDNSVTVMVSGNNAASQPLVLTTADNGANWADASLANTVRAQDLHLNTDGTFWATHAGKGNAEKYNADGTSTGTVVSYAAVRETSSAAPIRNEEFVIATGYEPAPFLTAYDSSSTELEDTSSDPIQAGAQPTGTLNGSTATDVVDNGDGTYTIYALSERGGVASWTFDTNPITSFSDWQMF